MIKANYPAKFELPGRSWNAIQSRASFLGLTNARPNKAWTVAEDEFLEKHYRDWGSVFCGTALDRTPKSVMLRAARLDIRTTPARVRAFWKALVSASADTGYPRLPSVERLLDFTDDTYGTLERVLVQGIPVNEAIAGNQRPSSIHRAIERYLAVDQLGKGIATVRVSVPKCRAQDLLRFAASLFCDEAPSLKRQPEDDNEPA